MTTYKNGIITKNKILETCKSLFYEKGYKDTTYVDICENANVSPGTITYFFGSKKIIAIDIYSDLLMSIKENTKKYLLEKYNEYNLRVATSLEQIIFTELIYTDEHYKRFYYDICVDGLLLESYIDKMDYFFKLHSDEYHLGFDEMELRLLQTTTTSIALGVTKKWIEGFIGDLSPEEYSNYKIKIMYNLMGVSNDKIDEILKKAYEIYHELIINPVDSFCVVIE
ncbi:MAG: TetR/AcrR family transcriptional regulator [Eubacteriaceae bacterium]